MNGNTTLKELHEILIKCRSTISCANCNYFEDKKGNGHDECSYGVPSCGWKLPNITETQENKPRRIEIVEE